MATTKRRSATELVAFHLGWDMADVRDCRYQAKRGEMPVFTCGDSYYCCPPEGEHPGNLKGFTWIADGTAYGRTIYTATQEA
jgi:hypothetical protein